MKVPRLVRDARLRRWVYLGLAAVLAVLCFFPRPWVARARIVPQDTSASAASTTSLLGALGSGSQSIGSLLTGGRPSNDLYLIIGRSDTVRQDVVRTLGLVGPDRRFTSERDAILWLGRKVDVHLLLGGVMEIETKLYDKDLAKYITGSYVNAVSRSLARFGKQLIENKRKIIQERFRDATDRVNRAEAEVNAFRRVNNLAAPEQQLGSALSQRAQLEGQLAAKQVELNTLRQFRGPDSPELQAVQGDIAGLRAQIARTTSPQTTATGPNVARLSQIDLRYLAIYRNLQYQLQIYNVYQRAAEQVAVEELASESASYVQIIDPTGMAPERQYNVWAIAGLAGVILLALFTEWYAPATGLTLQHARRDRLVEDYG